MPTITIRRHDVSTEEVTEALRAGLDPSCEVTPGMRMPRVPLLGAPRPDRPELILVSSGRRAKAQVRIVRHSGQTDLRVSPGLGFARKVGQALRDASGLRSRVR